MRSISRMADVSINTVSKLLVAMIDAADPLKKRGTYKKRTCV